MFMIGAKNLCNCVMQSLLNKPHFNDNSQVYEVWISLRKS